MRKLNKLDLDIKPNVDRKEFITEPVYVPTKTPAKNYTFRFDQKTASELEDLAAMLTGGNKTLALKAGMAALELLTTEQQCEIVKKIVS